MLAKVAIALPHVIHTEQENDACIARLEALHDRGNLSTEEEYLAELLTGLSSRFHVSPEIFLA